MADSATHLTRTEYVDATTLAVVSACRKWEFEGWAVRQITMTKQKQHGWSVGRLWTWLLRLEHDNERFWAGDEVEAIVVLERGADSTNWSIVSDNAHTSVPPSSGRGGDDA